MTDSIERTTTHAVDATFLDRNTISYERHYPNPVERVWRAITTESELPRWFVPFPTHLEPRVGARWWMDEPGRSEPVTFWGTIVDVQDERRLEMTWREGPAAMWFELDEDHAGTS